MAIQPSGFSLVSAPIDRDGEGMEGGVCATIEEARVDLQHAFDEFVRKAMSGATVRYFYGEGVNQRSTRTPVPEPPEGYRALVSQGMDHNQGEYEGFFAIPLGSTVMPRQNGEYLDHLHFKLQSEILWSSYWEVWDVVLPKGTLESMTEDGVQKWIPLQDWRRQKA